MPVSSAAIWESLPLLLLTPATRINRRFWSLWYIERTTQNTVSQQRRYSISQLCAYWGARGQVPLKPLLFGTLHEGSAIRFLESVIATAQTTAAVRGRLRAPSPSSSHRRGRISPSWWRWSLSSTSSWKLDKDPWSIGEGMICSSS